MNYAVEHTWTPLLDNDYSNLFHGSCNKYSHYLNTVIHGLDIVNMGQDKQDNCALTALDKNLFLPLELYAGEDGNSVIDDSGCTLAVAPYVLDFVGIIKPVQNIMNRLGVMSNVVGEGTVG